MLLIEADSCLKTFLRFKTLELSLKRDLRNYFETSCLDTKTEIELDGGGCGSILENLFL